MKHWLNLGLVVKKLLKLALGCPRKRGKFLYGNKVRKPDYVTILESVIEGSLQYFVNVLIR